MFSLKVILPEDKSPWSQGIAREREIERERNTFFVILEPTAFSGKPHPTLAVVGWPNCLGLLGLGVRLVLVRVKISGQANQRQSSQSETDYGKLQKK